MRAGRRTTSVAELLETAEQRETLDMVMACRQAASFLREEAAGTYGKSFRYWAKGPQGNRMVFGVNVSGERLNAPPANLYVWIPPGGLAEVCGMTAESIRDAINQRHSVQHSTDFDLVVGVHSLEEAQDLINDLKEWVSSTSVLR